MVPCLIEILNSIINCAFFNSSLLLGEKIRTLGEREGEILKLGNFILVQDAMQQLKGILLVFSFLSCWWHTHLSYVILLISTAYDYRNWFFELQKALVFTLKVWPSLNLHCGPSVWNRTVPHFVLSRFVTVRLLVYVFLIKLEFILLLGTVFCL